jgi:hypothetical protein
MTKITNKFIISNFKEDSEFLYRICYSFKKPFRYLSLEFEGTIINFVTPFINIAYYKKRFKIGFSFLWFTLSILYEDGDE